MEETGKVNRRGAAANDCNARSRVNRQIVVVETVRPETVRERLQNFGNVSKRTNSDRDDDTTGVRLLSIFEAQRKFIAALFNRADLDFLHTRRPTLLKSETVVTENIEPNRI